jgi:hypothetical protein
MMFITFLPYLFWELDITVARRLIVVWGATYYIGQGLKDLYVLRAASLAAPPPPSPRRAWVSWLCVRHGLHFGASKVRRRALRRVLLATDACAVWCGVVWRGAVWCGVVWRGVVCCVPVSVRCTRFPG